MSTIIKKASGARKILNVKLSALASFSFICALCITSSCFGGINTQGGQKAGTPIVRKLTGAGKWFPSQGKQLRKMVEGFIEEAECGSLGGRIVAAISPHAGYIYSGKVAGYAFRAIKDNAKSKTPPQTVVILGIRHRGGFPGVALMDGDFIETPLGLLKIDKESALSLCSHGTRIFFDYRPHIGEHSAENEIPFVQSALPEAEVVVGIMGDHEEGTVNELVEALDRLAETKNILVIASSDMMHNPDYDLVSATDRDTLGKVKRLDYSSVKKSWKPEKQTFCGIGPVLTVIRFSEHQGCGRAHVLHYRNSGDDFPSSRGQWVVGYCSVVFVKP